MDRTEIFPQLEALHRDACGWAVSCCGGDWPRGEDVLQNAYAKIARGSIRFEGRSTLKTWWFGVIRLTAFEEARRVRNWFHFLDRWRTQGDVEETTAPAPFPEDDADLVALAAALPALSARQREVLHLTFYQQLSVSEAAQVMHISVGSARQHYERGKARLRELLHTSKALHE